MFHVYLLNLPSKYSKWVDPWPLKRLPLTWWVALIWREFLLWGRGDIWYPNKNKGRVKSRQKRFTWSENASQLNGKCSPKARDWNRRVRVWGSEKLSVRASVSFWDVVKYNPNSNRFPLTIAVKKIWYFNVLACIVHFWMSQS